MILTPGNNYDVFEQGVAIQKLKTSSPSTVHLPELKTTSTHTVLVKYLTLISYSSH